MGIGQLLDQLGAIPPLPSDIPAVSPEIPPALPPIQAAILKAVHHLCQQSGDGSIPFDLIVQFVDLSAGEVSGELLQLELQGLVTQLPGMRYAPDV